MAVTTYARDRAEIPVPVVDYGQVYDLLSLGCAD